MAEENKNSGELYVSDQNDNITKLAEVITAEGGLTLTDAANGGLSSVFLSAGELKVVDSIV